METKITKNKKIKKRGKKRIHRDNNYDDIYYNRRMEKMMAYNKEGLLKYSLYDTGYNRIDNYYK